MRKLLLYLSVLFFILSVSLFGQGAAISSVAKVGQGVAFNVTADGTVPFNYQWKKNGTDIAGATANNYVIANVTTASAGVYTVNVSNAFGKSLSNNAELKVLAAPVFSVQPAGVNIFIGNTLTLTSLATGNPAPTYQWYKDNVLITGATSASYAVTNATATNSGTYKVVATSTLDGVTSSTTSTDAVVAVTGKAPSSVIITITIN